MAESHRDPTEQPTPRRRQRAREHGQVIRSRELHSAIVLFVAVLGLRSIGPWMTTRTLSQWAVSLAAPVGEPLTAPAVADLAAAWMLWSGKLMLPLFVLVGTAAVAGGALIQGGLVFSTHSLTPNLSRLNPIDGTRRLFSGRSGFGVLRDLFKVALVGWVCWAGVQQSITVFTRETDVGLAALWFRVSELTGWIALRTALVLLLAGLADYAFQRRAHLQELRMTKQEVRQEMKEAEGDPIMKGRIRSRQRDLMRRRMMEAVPTADVVVTNPTHLAVALKYDPATMSAPRVVAKGQRLIAERIKALAHQSNVPVVEDKPLARALFRMADIGGEIPAELYRAVAEILGYVYRQKGGAGLPGASGRTGGDR